MKVAITGHHQGIGAALAAALTQQGHQVLGFDIANNYDLTVPGIIEQIASESESCDVFINNAYVDIAQTKMLETMITTWENQHKLIVNISSKMTMRQDIYGERNLIYKHNKMTQNKIVRSRINIKNPHILNIISGCIDTGLSYKFPNEGRIVTSDFVQLVISLINIRDRIQVQEIIIEAASKQE